MSMREKAHHQRKHSSRARSLMHKHDGSKMRAVVNHVHFERLHGFESTKHRDKHASPAESAEPA